MQRGYEWLLAEGAPAILVQAIKLVGTKETLGAANNPTIIGWAKEVGASKLGLIYSKDEIPWCGLFMAVCAARAGLDLPSIAIRALSWSGWGNATQTPMLGDVLTFTRKGGGHVGIYVGEDAKAYHVLGGNQGDAVSITRIAKERLYSASRTKWKKAQPANVRRVFLTQTGALSENEA